MATVELKNLSKTYREGKRGVVEAVKRINLSIRDREFMVLVGPSGCGKSTTLRMIAGLEEITEGEIEIGERVVNNTLPKDRNIAMVFQNYALYPHMTVFDNMAFGLRLMKHPKREIQSRVRDAASILGIENLLDRKPKALSGGQRQRVAVGRAIVRKPKVFLFDEPLSNLDAKMRVSMRTEISKLHGRLNSTMIYVTHDQVEAMTMGDRITVMKDGDILQVDEPIALYEHPQNIFVAGFIGSPAMNFLKGALNRERDCLWFRESGKGEGGFSFPLHDRFEAPLRTYGKKEIIFGLRPEDITLSRPGERNPMVPVLEAKLEVAEPMGAEIFFHFRTETQPLIARAKSSEHHRVGEILPLQFNQERAHLFDPDSEKVLT